MDSLPPTPTKQYDTSLVVERDRLRFALYARYAWDRRYENLVTQDLAPRWRQALRSSGAAVPSDARFSELLSALDQRAEDGSALAQYCQVLTATVSGTMRLTSGGRPADWALESVHSDVSHNGGPDWMLDDAPVPIVSIELTVKVSVSDAGVSVSSELQPGGFSEVVDHPPDIRGVLDWSAYRADVDSLLDRFDAFAPPMITAVSGGIERRNPSSVPRWINEDSELLFKWLFYRTRTDDRAERERARQYCTRIGIDYPGD